MEKSIVGREKEKAGLKEYKVTGTKKSYSTVYVTPFGLYNNMYARRVNKQIRADDLFKKE